VAAGRDLDPASLQAAALAQPTMDGRNLAGTVSTAEPYTWGEGAGWWTPQAGPAADTPRSRDVVVMDCGVKRSILRQLAVRGCNLQVVPADTPATDILARDPDGIFLSNGPGDPAAVTSVVATVGALLGRVPMFGICLGHQILALALGARTYRLKFGHRGGNHPVRELDTGRVVISAHNHGFAVDAATLPDNAHVTHVSLNDGCCEGLAAPSLRAFSVQYHPESSPGPHDSDHLFDQFVELMDAHRKAQHAQA